MKKIFLSLFVLFGAVNSSFAVEIPDVMRKTMAQDPIGATGILQLVISMAFVIGLIYVTGWIYTKLNIVNRQKLDKINKDLGTTILMVTHDHEIVNKMKKRVLVLKDGRLVKDYKEGEYKDEVF